MSTNILKKINFLVSQYLFVTPINAPQEVPLGPGPNQLPNSADYEVARTDRRRPQNGCKTVRKNPDVQQNFPECDADPIPPLAARTAVNLLRFRFFGSEPLGCMVSLIGKGLSQK